MFTSDLLSLPPLSVLLIALIFLVLGQLWPIPGPLHLLALLFRIDSLLLFSHLFFLFLFLGILGSPWNIIISYNVHEHEIWTLSKSGGSSKIERFAYNDALNPVLWASVCWICKTYDSPNFQKRSYDTPSFQIRLMPLLFAYIILQFQQSMIV